MRGRPTTMRAMQVTLAILMLVAIACGSPEPVEPAPTPDVPLFADGEAVALVKADMLAREGNEGRIYCGELTGARTEFLFATSTTGRYLGQQVWSVTSDPFDSENFGITTLEWKVYEFSGVVAPANTITAYSSFCR